MAKICNRVYLQKVASDLARQHKALSFETAPRLSADRKTAVIRLRELFVGFLRNPAKFAAQGLKPPKGVLLYGPPGTGKTLLARAMAGESGVAFLPAAASGFVTRYQGSGPEAVRELFRRARRYAPSVVFIDELDAIGRTRRNSTAGHGEEMTLNALLTEMDGFTQDPKRPVFVLAATNFGVEEGQSAAGSIDPALVRRFDRRILVDLPNKADRLLYLRQRPGKRVTEALAERVARHESGHAYLCFLSGNTPSYLTVVARGPMEKNKLTKEDIERILRQ